MNDRRLVVFDVDGTLIDSQHLIIASMKEAFAAAGHSAPPDAAILSIVGLSLPEAMATLAPHLSHADIAVLAEHYRESFVAGRADGRDRPPLYAGALDALKRLDAKPDAILGVATGKARRGLDHIFALHDLGSFFATAQTADGHPSKPDPAMLRTALSETGCQPARAVMVGDTEFDILMGRAAGFATVGVSWGYHSRTRLVAAGADVIIDSFKALDTALATLDR